MKFRFLFGLMSDLHLLEATWLFSSTLLIFFLLFHQDLLTVFSARFVLSFRVLVVLCFFLCETSSLQRVQMEFLVMLYGCWHHSSYIACNHNHSRTKTQKRRMRETPTWNVYRRENLLQSNLSNNKNYRPWTHGILLNPSTSHTTL